MIKKIVKKGVSIALAPINKIVKRTNWYKNVTPEWGKFPIEKWYRTNLDRKAQTLSKLFHLFI